MTQMLARRLTPVMHSLRQQLINQVPHAAGTATAAIAVDSLETGDICPAVACFATTSGQDLFAQTSATAAGDAIASHMPGEVLDAVSSPFAGKDEDLTPSVSLGGMDRQNRRQEHSGSLPLEQMLSRLPSPIESSLSLDSHSSDELASQPPCGQLSK